MQSLYEWDFHHDTPIWEIAERVVKPVEKDVDMEYLKTTVEGTAAFIEEVDQLIAAAAPEWPLDQISVIDKSILRIAGFELLKSTDIPPKVAINEAVELAKTFGGENSSKFINGVLGTLFRNSDRFVAEEETKKDEQPEPETNAPESNA